MKNKSTIIVGAGIAGLAAANKLVANNHRVTLLEAREYIGGRIKTDHSLGIPFPCGAAFVHGTTDNPIYELLQKFNPKLSAFDNSPLIVYDKNKKQYSFSQLKKAQQLFDQLLREIKSSRRENDISLLEAINELLKNNSESTDLSWEILYLSIFTGVETKYLSAKNWDQMDELIGGNYLLTSSYEDLINDLAKNLDIHLGTIVKSICYDGAQIQVETNKGTYQADDIIITASLGVLQKNLIKFTPELPAIKKSSIDKLKMSQLNKIGLLFPKQFWPNDLIKVGFNADPNNIVPIFFNYAYFFNTPILLGAISGEASIELEKKGKAAFIDRTMNTLREIFGKDIPDPITTITTNWYCDPYSCGSYSYIPIGASGKDYDVIAEPVNNNLFFAGEATYRSAHSTVQGAYLSGIREAMNILKKYNVILA